MDKERRNEVAYCFGQVLRELRKQSGLSQEDLAGDAELDRTTPSLYERGLRNPTLTVLFQIANVLHVDASRMVELTQERLK